MLHRTESAFPGSTEDNRAERTSHLNPRHSSGNLPGLANSSSSQNLGLSQLAQMGSNNHLPGMSTLSLLSNSNHDHNHSESKHTPSFSIDIKPRPKVPSRSPSMSGRSPRPSLDDLGLQLDGYRPSPDLKPISTPRTPPTPHGSLPRTPTMVVPSNPLIEEAWDCMRKSLVYFRGKPIGTIAALHSPGEEVLNYNQVFVRDFVPSALAFLMHGEPEIVRNFLIKTLRLQAWEKRVDCFTLGEGVMPASFKVLHDAVRNTDTILADFGESAIGRVAPVDSGFWWIILLRAYTRSTGDHHLADNPEIQRGIILILQLCLSDGFDTFPTLLCADGCCMIDRRMGIYGYPLEIQALFYQALRCAQQVLKPEVAGKELLDRIDKRIVALTFHMRSYYWLDHASLNKIYRYKTEEYSETAVNKFNVIPESIPDWIMDFMPRQGGYFIGNVSPARMDFRWFAIGNMICILSSLATNEQANAIMDLLESRWPELIGEMPLKATYPALEGAEWAITTGHDPKNTRWSYHNGGSWPVILWMLTAACIKTGRVHIARKAIELVENRIGKDGWPEYYDGNLGQFIGKQARKNQTWSIAGYLVAKMLMEDPSHIGLMSFEEDKKASRAPMTRSVSWHGVLEHLA